MESLELFEETIRDIYYAEKAILKNLPKMAKKAKSQDLAAAFEEHINETEEQVARLEQIFEMIDKAPRGKRCPAIDGLAEEAAEIMQEAEDDTVRDAGMLAAAQAVEHYEIARYGTLAAWADKLAWTRRPSFCGPHSRRKRIQTPSCRSSRCRRSTSRPMKRKLPRRPARPEAAGAASK